MGIHGQDITVVDLESLVHHHCGFESHQGHWIISYEEGIQLAYRNIGGSTSVPPHA